MSHAIQRSSEFLFFFLGVIAIICVVLLKKDIATDIVQPLVRSIDLPLILAGMLYGGSSLYRSVRQDREFALPLTLSIAIPLAVLFLIFAYMNFVLPTSVS